MTALLNIALINAVTAVPLALLAWLIGRWVKRPSLTHTLWLLVLLKLVTPSPFRLPAALELPLPDAFAVAFPSRDADAGESVNGPAVPPDEARLSPLGDSFASDSSDSASEISSEISSAGWFTDRESAVGFRNQLSFSILLRIGGLVWLGGSLVWFAVQIVRAVRFRSTAMRTAIPSSHLQQQIHELASKMGLQFVPRVWLTESTISPMLWGCGARAKLLFPTDLATRLDDEACATLLAHELAHYVRGDHYVRVLELLATGLFWWHPVLWWARWQIEAAEEECCDALVVCQFPENPRKYAEALLDTIDFLCESTQALPPVACGLGQSNFLRRRLTKIMTGAHSRSLPPGIRPAILICAACLLPWQPFVFGSASSRHAPSEPARLTPEYGSVPESDPLPEAGREPDSSSSRADDSTWKANEPLRPPRPRRVVHTERIWATATSPNGRFVIRATVSRRLILTDLTNDAETDLSNERITAVAFGPNGAWFAATGHDGRITLWDSVRGELRQVVDTYSSSLRSVAVSPDGDRIAAGSPDGRVLLVDISQGGRRRELLVRPTAVNCVRFSPDGRQLAVAVGDWSSSRNGEVVVLDVDTAEPEATLNCVNAPGAITFASNHELIVGLWNGRTLFWNLANREVIGSAQADKGVISAAAFSQDNPVLREVAFHFDAADLSEPPSTFSVLQELFVQPARQAPAESRVQP